MFYFAVTTDPFTASNLASVIPEIWSTIVNEKTFDDTVLAEFCTDLSRFASSGGDTVHVPDFFTNALTVSTQSTQGAEITTASPDTVDTTLSINVHKYVAWIIGDKDLAQIASFYDVNEIYAREAVKLLTEALEAALAALWSSITTNVVGDTATVLSDAEIRMGLYKMEAGKYRLSECAFFVHPYVFWQQLHAVAKYYQQYSVGPSTQPGPVATGNFGSSAYSKSYKGVLFGVPVFTTTQIVSGLQTYRNLLLHKSAFGFAVQNKGGNKVRVQMENAIRNLGMLVVVDMVYGVGVLREPAAVLLNASSAFIGS
jgi:hypothetical protein